MWQGNYTEMYGWIQKMIKKKVTCDSLVTTSIRLLIRVSEAGSLKKTCKGNSTWQNCAGIEH